MKYHLGCGSQYFEGYCNVDFPPENHNVNHNVKVDLYADIVSMSYENCEEIRSHHFFEHNNYYDSMVLLYKWTNALIVGGKLVIDVPDLEELCKAYLAADTKTKFLVVRYLCGSHEGKWAMHINGWSKDTLTYILQELGYIIEDVEKYGDFTSNQPNCGIKITAKLETKFNDDDLREKIRNILALYKNGSTEFENSLHEYFMKKFLEKLI